MKDGMVWLSAQIQYSKLVTRIDEIHFNVNKQMNMLFFSHSYFNMTFGLSFVYSFLCRIEAKEHVIERVMTGSFQAFINMKFIVLLLLLLRA